MKRPRAIIRGFSSIRRVPPCLLVIAFCVLSGCADNKTGSGSRKSATDRQADALSDPFSYGPQDNQSGTNMPTVSGGKTPEQERKGLRRDLERFLNP